MKKFIKKVLSIDNFGATIFILLLIWASSHINFDAEGVSPISDMLSDFEITDFVASAIRDEAREDTNIILVNIGNLSREQIAKQIEVINSCDPKVIGIDAFFKRPLDAHGDSALANAFEQTKNLVLVTELHVNDTLQIFDSLITSYEGFMKNARPGFANLITEGKEKFRTARVFSPFDTIMKENGHREVQRFFGVEVAEIYKPGCSNELAKRRQHGYDTEIIWYKGNIYGQKCKYTVIEGQDILDSYFLPEKLKGKIVLMGYLGGELLISEGIWDQDKFFTPLNANYVGKAVPDMFGVVVHANIISMMLYDTYVDVSPPWLDLLLGFLFCFCGVAMFHLVLDSFPQLYDPITKLVQLIAIVIVTAFEAYVYMRENYKFDFGIALLAIALAPDLLEIYIHLLKQFVTFLTKKIYIRDKIQLQEK